MMNWTLETFRIRETIRDDASGRGHEVVTHYAQIRLPGQGYVFKAGRATEAEAKEAAIVWARANLGPDFGPVGN